MNTIHEILEYLNQVCPFELAEEWDNVGLNVGRGNAEVKTVLLALDVCEEAIQAAKERGCQLIITHHPLLFDGPRQINDSHLDGRRILALAENGIAHIACHTNLDAAPGGINDFIASLCDMQEIESLDGLGRMGKIPHSLSELAALLKKRIPAKTCLGVADHEQIGKAAIVGGSGGSMMEAAYHAGCDTFITGEAKHHHALMARDLHMNLLMFGHYETEYLIIEHLAALLQEQFPALTVHTLPHHPVLEQL